MTDLDLYWHEQPEPLHRTTDSDDLARVMEGALAYEADMDEEAEAWRRYRGPERVAAAFERLGQWRQIGTEERVAVVTR